jgi:hypothetical protein
MPMSIRIVAIDAQNVAWAAAGNVRFVQMRKNYLNNGLLFHSLIMGAYSCKDKFYQIIGCGKKPHGRDFITFHALTARSQHFSI